MQSNDKRPAGRLAAMSLAMLALALVAAVSSAGDQQQIGVELDRLRLLGAAHYENDHFKDAAAAYRRILELAPEAAIDHFNLGLVLMRDSQYDAAIEALGRAVEIDPELTGAIYVRGIVYKRQGNFSAAVAGLREVIERDPQCFGALYNLGLCHKLLEEFESAQEAFNQAIELDPEHPSPYYQMVILARRGGDVEEARRLSEIFDRLRDTIDESEKTVEALERSRYSYILEAPRFGEDLEPAPDAEVRFVDVTTEALGASPARIVPPAPLPERVRRDQYDAAELGRRYAAAVGGAVALRDVDADGRLDVYAARCATSDEGSANRFYRGAGDGRFREEAAGFGLDDAHCATDALFGDLDNDGHDDLYVVNAGPNVLYRKQGDGAFEGRGDEASNGLAILTLSEPLPETFAVEVALEARELEQGKHNAFLILDYRGPEDFKFVGARVDEGYWTIGHFDGAWVDDARLDGGIAPEEFHPLRLRIEGGRVELLPGFAGGDKNLVHDFGAPLHRGKIGFGVDGAMARFDNLRIGPVSGLDEEPQAEVPAFYAERFADGLADGFSTESGSWRVVAWGFDEVSSEARVDEPQFGRRGVLVDYDHDNDLDIYLANEVEFFMPADGDELVVPRDFSGQVNTLLRNNGNGTYADQTDESGLLVTLSRSHDVVFGDFDGDTDTDFLVLHADAASRLFTNLRLGRFAEGGSLEPPLERDAWAAATGDFNRDGHLDLVVAVGERVLLYANDGAARFEATPVPAEIPGGVGKIEILDFNNDGWADLLLVPRRREGLALLAATGPAAFRDVSAQVGLAGLGRVADVAVGDLDGDGDQDLVALSRDDGLHLYDNRGGNQRHWLDVQLVGKKVNRSGYGATLEIASEGHYQKYLIDEGRIHLGLGELAAVDVVRVLWPNGVAQNVVAPGINTAVTIEEYVKVSASCGFLWASAGSGFELINEILGIGPLGAPIAPGVYHQPDSTELTLIEGDQLAPRDGRYELRLTEELREIMYADQISLRVIDHPAELEIVPNEKFVAPPFPEDRFFALADARPPRAAVDDQGRDVGELIARRDGRFPIFPRLEQYDGLAEAHALTLDLGELDDAGEALLFLDGWIYWPEASVSTAVAQDPEHELRPLELQVRNARGEWETAMTVGLPTSKGLVVPVELTPLLPLASPEIRLTTNMSIYFDRIFVATRDQPARCRTTELPVAAADLHYRGFSRLDRDDVGYERFDYDDVSLTGSWNPPRGMFTRYGDVTPLLEEPDDRYAIFGPGDELTMHFDAGAVPELPAGWRRDYIFYADGWVKDGDLNTKYSGTVEPLPFHGMSGYPYPETEHYPRTPETDAYLREYNTRPAVPTVGRLAYTGSGR